MKKRNVPTVQILTWQRLVGPRNFIFFSKLAIELNFLSLENL